MENLIDNKEISPVDSRRLKIPKTSNSPSISSKKDNEETIAQFTEFQRNIASASSGKSAKETRRRPCYQSQQPSSTTSSPTTHTSVKAADDGDGKYDDLWL